MYFIFITDMFAFHYSGYCNKS